MKDRDRILQRTNGGLDVFVHYLGEACKKKLFKNPYRTDYNPSCNLYYKEGQNGEEGRFILNDFGDSDFNGDCFSFVARLHSLNPKTHFVEILRIIDKECNLFILEDTPEGCRPAMKKVNYERPSESRPVKFTPKYRNFNKYELSYWLSYGIRFEILSLYNVRSLTSCNFERADGTGFTINSTLEVPMFGYTFNEGTGIKVYRPNAKLGRFLYAGNLPRPYIFGLEQLKSSSLPTSGLSPVKTEYVFITGGEKDVMSLAARGFNAISLNSETARLSHSLLDALLMLSEHVIFLYDSDETGIRESASRVNECRAHLCNKPANTVVNLTLPLSGTKQDKDISDFFRAGHSATELQDLVSAVINKDDE